MEIRLMPTHFLVNHKPTTMAYYKVNNKYMWFNRLVDDLIDTFHDQNEYLEKNTILVLKFIE